MQALFTYLVKYFLYMYFSSNLWYDVWVSATFFVIDAFIKSLQQIPNFEEHVLKSVCYQIVNLSAAGIYALYFPQKL